MVKINFQLEEGGWHGGGHEGIWATPIAKSDEGMMIFRLENSPFFARGIAYRDLIEAEIGNDAVLEFVRVFKRGGHSTYMILAPKGAIEVKKYLEKLNALNCTYESTNFEHEGDVSMLYSFDVPPNANIRRAFAIMSEAEQAGVWIFQEGYARSTG